MQVGNPSPKKRISQRDGAGQNVGKKVYLSNQYNYNANEDEYSPS